MNEKIVQGSARRLRRFAGVLLRYRRPIVILGNLCLVSVSNIFAFWLRFDGDLTPEVLDIWMNSIFVVIGVRLLFIWWNGLNEGMWRYAGVNDACRILKAVAGSSVALYLVIHGLMGRAAYPRSVFVIDALLLLLMLGGVRMTRRIVPEALGMGRNKGRRVVFYGAGDAGAMVLHEIRQNPAVPFRPVAFIDDDPKKRGLRIEGVPVLGNRADLAWIIEEHRVEEVIVTMPSASARLMRDIVRECGESGLSVKTVPGIGDLLNGRVGAQDIRQVRLEDLLSREVIQTDMVRVRTMLAGRRILVTGGGGSIGSELCRQIASCDPEGITILDQCENRLYLGFLELGERFPKIALDPIVADICNAGRMERILKDVSPHIIFHAAAYKHLPLMENDPVEAVSSNILATRNLALMAGRHGVEKFILISTDKAVRPTSVMGATKRVAEMLVSELAAQSGRTTYTTVRFGNVMGSNGSVIPIFRNQIERGGPVTVTHPDVRRFFMTTSEAVQLVLQSAVMGQGGEVFVLDMGEQIRILDLAKNLITLSGLRPGDDIPIVFTGLRKGEKLEEELFDEGEISHRTSHPKIKRATGVPLRDPLQFHRCVGDLDQLRVSADRGVLIEKIAEMVPSYTPVNGETVSSDTAYRLAPFEDRGDRLPAVHDHPAVSEHGISPGAP